MTNNLSREEEQRGWRGLYLWIIPLALIGGTILVFAPSLMNWLTDEEQRGMDQVATQQGPVPGQQALGPAKLEAESHAEFGQYLTDGSGRPLYIFSGDTRGTSNCHDACAKAWPPLLTSGQPEVSEGVQQTMTGVIPRDDAESSQVTYSGWPLYTYVKDVGPEGEVAGHDIEDFGHRWYLVSPTGEGSGKN